MRHLLKRVLSCIVGAAMIAVSITVSVPAVTAQAAAVTPETGNIYYIKNKNSGLYLTVEGDSASDGANVIQSTGTGSLGQRWILEKNSSTGYYRLHPATDMTGGVSLDVYYGSASDGTNIDIYANNGYTAQNFAITAADSNSGYYISTEVSNFASCLDVSGASTSSGANVQEYTNWGGDCQIWYFEQASWPSSSSSSSSTSASTSTSTSSSTATSTANAVDSTYAQQQLQFVNCSDGYYVTGSSTSKGTVTAGSTSSTANRFVLSYKGSGVYRIVNAATGYCLTPSGSSVTSGKAVTSVAPTANDSSQLWKVVSVKNDTNGDALNYKIVSYSNTSLALTLSGSSYVLGSYTGASSQCFRVNSYGAEGFAGYSHDMSGNEKTSVTGGVFGQTVEADTLSELQTYAAGSTAYTIVITGNISASSLTKVSVGSNKTFIGSYSAHTLYNVHFRNISSSGNNIYKNITFSHDVSINNNDDIQMYISDGDNFWLDHCTWTGHDMTADTTTHSSDTDKFLYVGLKADYVSVTGCYFGGHKYGVILGYPAEDGASTYDGYPCMTICNSYFKQSLTRAPGLMRYGYFHCYNNYVYDFNLGYTPYTDCNIYSENNFFDAGSYKGCVVNDMGEGNFTDSGSVLSSDISSISLDACTWRPSTNYSYATRTASSAKTWDINYAGAQSSAITYAID